MSQADTIWSAENCDGSISWYNSEELFKVVHPNGIQFWYQNGWLHRDDGPAIVKADGTQFWYQNGELHRDDGPAAVYPNGTQLWHQNGKLHRTDGPAIVEANGSQSWWQNGVRLETYCPDLGCAKKDTHNRRQAIERLNRKPRPYSYKLYMADIDRLFPEEN